MGVGIRTALISSGLLCLGLLTVADAAGSDTGQQVYDTYCTTCHGDGGQLDPTSPVIKGLGVTPADFSDPLFNSREPAEDWHMVIKYGGHALGLAEQMPAQGEVLSDEQIDDVTAYLKSLVETSAYPPGEMNLMLPIRTKKAFPEDEVVYVGRYTDQDGDNAYKQVLEIEKRIGKAGQGHFMGNPANNFASPLFDPNNYGGTKLNITAGLQWQPFPLNIIELNGSVPIYQNLNGPQLAEQYRLMLSWYIEIPTSKSRRYTGTQPPKELGF